MKNLFLATFCACLSFVVFAQEAKVTTNKRAYTLEEVIEVTFELNAKYDSMVLPEFNGFTQVGGPTQQSSVTVKNGEMIKREAKSYRLKANKRGRLKIKSPIYFIDGRKIKSKPLKIKVK